MDDRIEYEPTSADGDTTRWSVVIDVRNEDSEIARSALSTLCEAYWYPVYYYVRRRVNAIDEAHDLTQAFFTKLIEKNYAADARRERGKFRAFLFTAVRRFLANEWDKERAAKARRRPYSIVTRLRQRRSANRRPNIPVLNLQNRSMNEIGL